MEMICPPCQRQGFSVSFVRMKPLVRAIFPFIVLSAAFSQHHQLQFDHITTRDGLSQDIVTCIAQDAKGFMWIGTEDGLNRYDGYSIGVYRSNMSDSTTITWNSVNAMMVDRKGRLWVSASGASLYDERRDGFVRYVNSPTDSFSLPNNHVTAFTQDTGGSIWAATDQGVAKLDFRSGRWTDYRNRPNDPSSLSTDLALSLLTDRSGTMWVGTKDVPQRGKNSASRFRRSGP
jgi:ligand-binding sensor domain-containing protein